MKLLQLPLSLIADISNCKMSSFKMCFSAIFAPNLDTQPQSEETDSRREFTVADDGLAVASVQVGPLDDVVLGVHPVHAAACVVNGEAVWPEQVCVCDDPPVGAVHVGVLDARCVAPVRPVDLPEGDSGTAVVSQPLYTCCSEAV